MGAETAGVVVVGGGVVGASVAYHLAEAGASDVLVLERGARQGSGSTGRATGGVRAQFSTPVNVRMSLHSIEFFRRFEEATGHACGYLPRGYLFAATSERQFEYLKAARDVQAGEGLEGVELWTAARVARAVPGMLTGDVTGATFCPSDGFIDPLAVMRGFTERARSRGVRFRLDTAVTGIELEGGRVAGVGTTRGRVSARAVVNAAGAHAAGVARMAGVDLPVAPVRRQIVAVGPYEGMPAGLPMVVDMSDGFHFRPFFDDEGRDAGVLLAWHEAGEAPHPTDEFDSSFVPRILKRAAGRVPALARARVEPGRSRAGLYEMTPDGHAVVGRAPGVEGFYLANGFSGHGVMHSPATGLIVSELILEGESRTLDATPLRPERFAEGRLLAESTMI